MVQRAPPHVGERRNLDGIALEQLGRLVESHQIVQGVVQRPQIRIDFLREVARQKTEPLAGFDGRPDQDDALDRVALERIDGAGDGEIGLAGAGGTDAEGDVVFLDVAQVEDLVRRPPVQVGASSA